MGSRAMRKGKQQPRTLWKLFLFASALTVFVTFLWLGASLYRLYGETFEPLPPDETVNGEVPVILQPKPGERINILILGLDDRDDDVRYRGARSDTIMVVSIDPLLRQIGVLSIPRDTLISIPGYSDPEKANHAHAYGGASLALRSISGFLGVTLHYYIRLDFGGFVNLVDVLGGVEITVDEHMEYEDPYQDLIIDIPAGTHTMDGDTALKYVRYRDDNDADIGRISRQQHFLSMLVNQSLRLGTVFRLNQIMGELERNVQHNVPGSVVAQLMLLAPRLPADSVSMGMVPGRAVWINKISFWEPDADGAHALIDTLLLGVDPVANSSLTVELVDGTGSPGLALNVVHQLQAWGYNVSLSELNGGPYLQTQVINSLGDQIPGKLLTRNLDGLLANGIGVELFQRVGDTEGPDITVILGQDFGG